jgi:hypothetical protein
MRHDPSRRILPPSPGQPIPFAGWTFLAALLAGLAWWAIAQPMTFAIASLLLVNAVFIARDCSVTHSDRLRDLAESRVGESICTFARSFDCRTVDTRIIRATYEELLPEYEGLCPIRASDRFAEEIGIDEDWDQVAIEVARRAGRSLDYWAENRFTGKIETVADLVHYLNDQPLAEVA